VNKFGRLKNSWLISNRHYLVPVFLIIAVVNAGIAAVFAAAVFGVWVVNILRARLPIDPGGTGMPETLIYKKIGGSELRLDVWRATGGTEGLATVVFAHGGGWISGARNQPNNLSWCRFLSGRGFSVVSIDYRFAYAHHMSEIVEDFSDAVEFVRDNAAGYNLSHKIILMGLSAGGHLALCHAAFNTAVDQPEAAAAMKDVLGVVAYYAPSDLKDLFSPDDKSFFARFGAGTAMKSLPRFDSAAYEAYSPVNRFTAGMVPVLAVHGRQDEVVPYISSVKMVKKLKEMGVQCRFLVHKTGTHGFEVRLKDYRTTMILEETVRFMKALCSDN